jgi:hypothetical protein
LINLRFTKKLLSRLHVTEFEEEDISSNLLGEWYANCIILYRKPYVLFTNKQTILSIVIPLKESNTLLVRFLASLREVLTELRIPEYAINYELNQMSVIKYGHTNNRSLLGNMKDLSNGIYNWFDSEDYHDLLELNLYLSNWLAGPEPYRRPYEEVIKAFKKSVIV